MRVGAILSYSLFKSFQFGCILWGSGNWSGISRIEVNRISHIIEQRGSTILLTQCSVGEASTWQFPGGAGCWLLSGSAEWGASLSLKYTDQSVLYVLVRNIGSPKTDLFLFSSFPCCCSRLVSLARLESLAQSPSEWPLGKHFYEQTRCRVLKKAEYPSLVPYHGRRPQPFVRCPTRKGPQWGPRGPPEHSLLHFSAFESVITNLLLSKRYLRKSWGGIVEVPDKVKNGKDEKNANTSWGD